MVRHWLLDSARIKMKGIVLLKCNHKILVYDNYIYWIWKDYFRLKMVRFFHLFTSGCEIKVSWIAVLFVEVSLPAAPQTFSDISESYPAQNLIIGNILSDFIRNSHLHCKYVCHQLCGAFENHIFTSSPEPDVKRMALSYSNCISMGDSMVLIRV